MCFVNITKYDDILSKERQLSGRQIELDIVKGLSVLLMVGSHVFNQFAPLTQGSASESGFLDSVSRLIGAFPGGAQCFMMVMGILILFSTKITPIQLMKRGLILIVVGFVLEFLRILPGIINMLITGDLVSFYPEYSYATNEQLIILTLFWQDILIFAGMALVFIGGLQYFKVSDIWVIVITSILIVINCFISGTTFDNDAMNIFGGYFFGTTVFDGNMTTSRFPFLSWIIYPVFGYLIGKIMIRTTNKKEFYKRTGLLCFLISLPFMFYGMYANMFYDGFTGLGFYHQTALINIWCALLSYSWIALMFLVSEKLSEKVLKHPERWSKNITKIYVLHFVILAVFIQILPRAFDIIGCSVIFILLFIAVDYISENLLNKKHDVKEEASV